MKKIKLILNIMLVAILVLAGSKLSVKAFELKKSEDLRNELKTISESEILKSKNEDYRFWLNVDGTKVDYPVLQSTDNDFYLNHDFKKEASKSGSVVLDFRNDSLNDKNTIIYAHNMKDGSMFGDLKEFKKEEFFNNHGKITINNNDEISTYEIFSVYVRNNSTDYLKVDFEGDEFEEYLNDIQERSMHKSDVEVNTDDKIITFSTCSYEFKNARLVIHAKLID